MYSATSGAGEVRLRLFEKALYKQFTFRIVEINDETVPEAGHASHRKSNSYAPAAS
jgi:hypothetical protein